MSTNTVKGIIYRIYNSGQSDKILHLIDKDGTKNTLLAKGAKKSTSRKSHSIELCNYVEVKIIEGYQLAIISEIKVIDEFIPWKSNNSGILLIQLFCEIIDKLCYENNKDSSLFSIFYEVLNSYNTSILMPANAFVIKAIWHTGSIASITSNAISGSQLDANNIYFSNQIAGYISKEDLTRNIELMGEPVSAIIAKSQKFLIENSIAKAVTLDLSVDNQMKMLQISLDWFEIITEQRLKSKGIILNLVGKLNKQI